MADSKSRLADNELKALARNPQVQNLARVVCMDVTEVAEMLYTTVRLGRLTYGDLLEPDERGLVPIMVAVRSITMICDAIRKVCGIFAAASLCGFSAAQIAEAITPQVLQLFDSLDQFKGKTLAQVKEHVGSVRAAQLVRAVVLATHPHRVKT